MKKASIKIFGLNSSISKARYIFSLPTMFHGNREDEKFAFVESTGRVFNYASVLGFGEGHINHGDQFILGYTDQGPHFSEREVELKQELNDYFISICDLESIYPEDFSTLSITLPQSFNSNEIQNDRFFEALIGRLENCVVAFNTGADDEWTFYSTTNTRKHHLPTENAVTKKLVSSFQSAHFTSPTTSIGQVIYRPIDALADVKSSHESFAFRKFGHIDSFLINDEGRFDEKNLLKVIERCSDPMVAKALSGFGGVAMNGMHIATMASHCQLDRAQRHGLISLFKSSSLIQDLLNTKLSKVPHMDKPREGYVYINSVGLKTGCVDFGLYASDPSFENWRSLKAFKN